MKNETLVLKFRDSGIKIEFGLKNNLLFYGINGRGKTRALKSIHLVHELAASPLADESLSILEKLHLVY